jgi:hypothetical protein
VSDESWLIVFVLAPIERIGDGNTELAVEISSQLVPIQHLTELFVGSKCASYAEKPKLFFFLDNEAEKKVNENEDGKSHSVCHVFWLLYKVDIFYHILSFRVNQCTNKKTSAPTLTYILGFLFASVQTRVKSTQF